MKKKKTRSLLPCPWCGAEAESWIVTGESVEHGVTCSNPECSVRPSATARSTAAAVRRWNARLAPSPLAATAIEARELLDRSIREAWDAARLREVLQSFAASLAGASRGFGEAPLAPGPFGAVYMPSLGSCAQCGMPTRWVDIGYGAPLCSPECAHEFGPQPQDEAE